MSRSTPRPRSVALRYVGACRYVPGIPARDLSGIPVADARRLIATGLYALVKPVRQPKDPSDG